MRALTEGRALKHHLRMTAAGFMVGSSIAVPTAILLNGWIYVREVMLQPPSSSIAIKPVQNTVEPTPVAATAAEPARGENAASARREVPQPVPVKRALDERLEKARALLARGEVERVREVLAEDGNSPEAAFLLAATFDPNVLASLNVANARAEVARARRLYTQALIGGVLGARQRLDALQ